MIEIQMYMSTTYVIISDLIGFERKTASAGKGHVKKLRSVPSASGVWRFEMDHHVMYNYTYVSIAPNMLPA